MSLNKVMLIGNVGKDPEIRYLDGGGQNNPNAKVANFTLATSERYRDRNGNPQERTEWHNIVAWRNSADIAEKYVKKGTQLYIEGKLRTRDWTDQSGNKRYTTEVYVDSMQLLGRKSDNPGASEGGQQYGSQTQYGRPTPQYSAPSQQAYEQPQQAPAPQQAYGQPQQAPPLQQVYYQPQQPAGPMPSQQATDEPSDDLPF
ncbi:MAG: single-stranded DNA-binding protein [Bacteroidales bacterium]|jgi:single-strand DNA-binding protein|nr:single-stranded DNA-binding protein [Bacteroidales bacterium]MCI2134537.1 single-stranded DNA-binding protein [Bacteroidales bacterium]